MRSASKCLLWFCTTALLMSAAPKAHGFFVDGDGHYGLLGTTNSNIAFDSKRGNSVFQAIQQSFRLLGEVRSNDKLSFKMELRLFDNPRTAYLGDTAQPTECNVRSGDAEGSCADHPQRTTEPGYKSYTPKVTEAYVQYAFDYCLLTAGRRGRDWGMGVLLDSGKKPFSTESSIFDGATCNINIQKSQTLGLSFGYDKLAETGVALNNPYDSNQFDPATDGTFRNSRGSAAATDDDIDQYFFTIEYNDRKANAGAPFTKQIGFYLANVVGKDIKTDVKLFDLYTAFFIGEWTLRNEFLFRLGRSGDPSFAYLGGRRWADDAPKIETATNNTQAVGFAGEASYTFSRSGSNIGPVEYNQGDARRHLVFIDYAYSPGDSDGYANDDTIGGLKDSDRNRNVTALPFHRNFKPALILFNQPQEVDDLKINGAVDPGRFLNATAYGLGYRYENLDAGNIETKFIYAFMNQAMSGTQFDNYTRKIDTYKNAPVPYTKTDIDYPVGSFGKGLGFELDLKYSYNIGKDLELLANGAIAFPGKAWQTRDGQSPSTAYLFQGGAAFKF